MENPGTFKLIDGTFSAKDARDILNKIVSAKINFHSLKQFSETERFGNDQSQSAQRIAELKMMTKNLNAMLEEAEGQGLKLKIQSHIHIEPIK